MLFDSTLRKDLARSFGATLIVILTIVLTMFLIRTLGQAASGGVSPQDVVLILGYTALGHLSTMLSLSLFIAVVATVGRMYRDSEMVIWFSSGLGLFNFIAPVLRMGWPIVLAVAALTLLIYPWSNQQSAQLKARYEQRSDLSRVAPGQFQSSKDGSRVFFIDRDADDAAQGRNVFILSTLPRSQALTTARSGHITSVENTNYLVLDGGQRHEHNLQTGDKTVAQFGSYQIEVGERPSSQSDALQPKARTTLELLGLDDARAKGELTWRLGLVLGCANLMLLGLGLAATPARRASSWNLLFALLAFIVYYNLITLSQTWVAQGKVGMLSILLNLHLTALAMALGLIVWRTYGTHFSWVRRLPKLPPT
jgi:lipopolysaccharide export system permease protein